MEDDVNLKLIECFRKRAALWHNKDPQFFNKSVKMLLWQDIAQEMKMNSAECQHTILLLRSKYRKEMVKIKQGEAKGEVYEPSWVAFKSFQFLDDQHIARKKKKENKENDLESISSLKKKLDCLKLIRCYKARALFWDRDDPKHENTGEIDAAWGEVGKKMGMTSQECRKRMLKYTIKLRGERSKIKEAELNGKVFVSKWFPFKSISFLDDNHKVPRLMIPKNKRKNISKKRFYSEDDTSSEEESVSDLTNSSDDEEEEMNNDNRASVEGDADDSLLINEDQAEPIQNYVFSSENNAYFRVNPFQPPNQNENFAQQSVTENQNDNFAQQSVEENHNEDFAQQSIVENQNGNFDQETSLRNQSFSMQENEESSPQKNSPEEDAQCQSFGVFIGNKLKMYPSSTRNMVITAFNNIIFSADEGYVEPQQYHATKYKLHK